MVPGNGNGFLALMVVLQVMHNGFLALLAVLL